MFSLLRLYLFIDVQHTCKSKYKCLFEQIFFFIMPFFFEVSKNVYNFAP